MTPAAARLLASIPSPSTSVWHLGPFPLRAYALCIVLGIVAAAYLTEKRMRSRGAPQLAILDVVVWAVPAGIIGARIYSVITTPQPYFGKGGQPIQALYIWNGGLGIWGAVAGGAVGAWLACRRLGIPLSFVADALAVGLPVAQGIGRFGNWFNNELYGRVTTLPWGLRVHRAMIDGKAVGGYLPGLYQPTFLYEAIWDFGTALLVYLADRRFKFGRGRAFALYVMAYTVGRAWIEYLRIDPANRFLGLRLNDWTCLVVFIGALIFFLRVRGPQLILTPDAGDGPGAEPAEIVAGDESDRDPDGDTGADTGAVTGADTAATVDIPSTGEPATPVDGAATSGVEAAGTAPPVDTPADTGVVAGGVAASLDTGEPGGADGVGPAGGVPAEVGGDPAPTPAKRRAAPRRPAAK